jgi:hypothetical protein
VKVSVTDVLPVALAARSLTLPGVVVVAGVTVIADVPTTPEHVARTFDVPVATPVTTPLALTVATDVLVLDHVGVQLTALPFASRAAAVSVCVAPTRTDAELGLTVTDATTVDVAGVVAIATLERLPYVAFRFIVPRNAMTWNAYVRDAVRPRTVHVNFAPIDVPLTGVVHVPLFTLGASPHEIDWSAKRTSYFAGTPVPSVTCVNVSVTEVEPLALALKSVTLPGAVAPATTALTLPDSAAIGGTVDASVGARRSAQNERSGINVSNITLETRHLEILNVCVIRPRCSIKKKKAAPPWRKGRARGWRALVRRSCWLHRTVSGVRCVRCVTLLMLFGTSRPPTSPRRDERPRSA